MPAKFCHAGEAPETILDWGLQRWISNPDSTDAKQLIVVEVELAPGNGHDFHFHPLQEEVLYVISGTIEQWIETKKQNLTAGGSVFLPAGVIHATFNTGIDNARFLAILGPVVGDEGIITKDVSDDPKWTRCSPSVKQ